MKRCSTSLNIKEMQIETTVRYHFTPVRMAIIKWTQITNCWQGCVEKGILYIFCGNVIDAATRETEWKFFKKLKIEPAITLLGICLKKAKTLIWKDNTPQCLYQNYLQLSRYGRNISVYQQVNGWRRCDTHTHTHTHTGIILSHKKE